MGGIRSGKSRYALELSRQHSGSPKCFLATAQPLDEEMKLRIARHKEERTQDFITIEEPLDLARVVQKSQKEFSLILVDCLTVWVGNLFHHLEGDQSRIRHEIESFIDVVACKKVDMIFITNEVGLGLIPDDPLSRRYLDELGSLNQNLASLCDEVVLMVSGIPKLIKGEISARLEI